MKVLIDTTPLYALLDRRDQGHERALELFGRAMRDTLLVPLPTVLELHGLLIRRKPSDPGAAHESLRAVLSSYILRYPTENHVEAARELIGRYGDQKLTLTDALIVSMAASERAQVMTFDARHFTLMGATLYE